MMTLLHRERGATVVEFAIVLPLFLILVFGIVDFGRYYSAVSSVNTASRESARYGSSVGDSVNGTPRYTDCSEIIAAGTGFGITHGIAASDYTITYDHGTNGSQFSTCSPGSTATNTGDFEDSDRIVVTVETEFEFITPIVGSMFGTVSVDSTDRRTLLSL